MAFLRNNGGRELRHNYSKKGVLFAGVYTKIIENKCMKQRFGNMVTFKFII